MFFLKINSFKKKEQIMEIIMLIEKLFKMLFLGIMLNGTTSYNTFAFQDSPLLASYAEEPASSFITDEMLSRFADAQEKVNILRAKYNNEESGSNDHNIINDEIINAIEAAGLTVTQFQTIEAALETNPSLRERYMKYL